MKSRAVRLLLFCVFVAAVGAAAYVFWTNEVRVRRQGNAARAFDFAALAAIVQVHEIRSSQQGYVAAGQGEDFWISKVAETTASLRDSIAQLQGQATSGFARTALQTAAQSLLGFEQMDRRAREYARSGQKLLASDLVYADGLALTAAAAAAIEEGRQLEASHEARSTARARLEQFGAAGGVVALGLLLMAMLVPAARQEDTANALSIAPRPAPVPDPADEMDALDAGWNTKAASPSTPVRPPLDLAPIASLCTDLARVSDTQSLPALLERASTVLEASGIVIWIADPDGRELMPVLTYGYPQSVVTRLGTLLRDAQNATAAAFRTGLLQTVRSDAMSNGAIAAPLVTPTGCVGVMAAEVRHDGEQDGTKRAAAAIVAAQLATLVGPPSARTNHSRAEAARA